MKTTTSTTSATSYGKLYSTTSSNGCSSTSGNELRLSGFLNKSLLDEFKTQINWANEQNNALVLENLRTIVKKQENKILANVRPYYLPERLWRYLLQKSGLSAQKKWRELGNKGLNKLVTLLTNDVYLVKGRTSFREEFVTCGGVSLENIDFNTMQSKVCENLYFTGELIDIDGITGGFNFQAAWTTAFIAGKLN